MRRGVGSLTFTMKTICFINPFQKIGPAALQGLLSFGWSSGMARPPQTPS
jgi:hypothetical protein